MENASDFYEIVPVDAFECEPPLNFSLSKLQTRQLNHANTKNNLFPYIFFFRTCIIRVCNNIVTLPKEYCYIAKNIKDKVV